MTTFVMDSSVGVSWAHVSQATSLSASLLSEVEKGAVPVVPPLWLSEVANTLLMLERRKKITQDLYEAAIALLSSLPLEMDAESPSTAFNTTTDLARRYGLTVYDAHYLELAIRRNLPLATRDEALKQAARHCGIALL